MCWSAQEHAVWIGEMSPVKAASLYAYYNAMLIQRINFLDMSTEPDAAVTDCWAQGSVPKTEVARFSPIQEEEEEAVVVVAEADEKYVLQHRA